MAPPEFPTASTSSAAAWRNRRLIRQWVQRAYPLVVAMVGLGAVILCAGVEPLTGQAFSLMLALPIILMSALLGGAISGLVVGGGALAIGEILPGGGFTYELGQADPAIYLGYVVLFAIVGEERRRRLRRAEATAQRLKLVEERVGKIARLNALGEVAGTLAHEINQPLSAVASFLAALQKNAQRADVDPLVLAGLASRAAAQVTRAHDIITRIRGSLAGEVQLAEVDLAGVLQATLGLPSLEDRLASVDLEVSLAPDATVVCADEVQLQQILMNLVGNAVEAMEGQPQQIMTIVSRRTAEGNVELTVSDTGPGLSPEIEDYLFEPFATSKAAGTGLGLAISRSIARSFCGDLTAHSEPGQGADFRLRLRAPHPPGATARA